MQLYEAKLRELSQKRLILEKKTELRKATLVEFEAAHEERNKKLVKSLEAENKKAYARNSAILREISCSTVSGYANLRDYSETKSKNAALLNEERKRYAKCIEGIQPVWKAESVLRSENNLAKLKADREYVTNRRQAWQAEAAKEEVVKSALEMERRELMIQLALEQKDKISADTRVHGIIKQRESLETVLVDELTSYGEECKEKLISMKIDSSLNHSKPSASLDLNSSVNEEPPRHRPYAVGAGRGVSADYTNNMIDALRQRFQNHSTVSTLPLPPPNASVSGALAHASREYYHSMLNEQQRQLMKNNVSSHQGVLEPSRQVVLTENAGNPQTTEVNTGGVNNQQHIYGTSFPSAPLQQPSPSALSTQVSIEPSSIQGSNFGQTECDDPRSTPRETELTRPSVVTPIEVNQNQGNSTPLPSLHKSTSPVTTSEDGLARLESVPLSVSTSNSNSPLRKTKSPNSGSGSGSGWTLTESSSIVHCTDTDLTNIGTGENIACAEYSDSNSDANSDSSLMAASSPKTPKSNNSSTKKPTWDDVVDVSTPAASNVFTRLSSNTTPSSSTKIASGGSSTKEMSASKSVAQEFEIPDEETEMAPGLDLSTVRAQSPAEADSSNVQGFSNLKTSFAHSESPSTSPVSTNSTAILRYTDQWKTIQCVVALKQLYERFEDNPGKPEVTKRIYRASMKAMCVAHSTIANGSNQDSELHIKSIAALNVTKASFRLVMPAALQKRTKELAVYSNDLVILSCIDVILERVDQLIPLELLNGIVTMEKLNKHYKRTSGGFENAGLEDMLNAFLAHLKFLIETRIFSMDEIVQLYVDALTSELLTIDGNHSDANRTRIARKLTSLLKDGVLNGGTHGHAPQTHGHAPSPGPGSHHSHDVATAEKAPYKAPYSNASASTNKKNVSFSAAHKFVDLDDDEFIMDDEPIEKPPQMRDLSLLVEPTKGSEDNGGKHGKSFISQSETETLSGVMEDEFDFF